MNISILIFLTLFGVISAREDASDTPNGKIGRSQSAPSSTAASVGNVSIKEGFEAKNGTSDGDTPRLTFYPPALFFDIDSKTLLKSQRILLRLRRINKNLRERARIEAFKMKDPYLNIERFTKSKMWRFLNFLRLKLKKRKRFQAKAINVFSFEKYLILDKNSTLPNVDFHLNKSIAEITSMVKGERSQSILDKYNSSIGKMENASIFSDVDNPSDYSGVPVLREPRRPKNIIIAIVGVCSDELYFESFKYTYYPFLSQIKMYGEEFEKDTGIIFPHPYLRKFKPLGPAFWSYRYSWADFAFGFRTRKINLNQWMYSVESILKLINYLVERDKYNPRNIFIYGYSQGGAMALSVALRSKYILGGVVSTASFLPERTSARLIKMNPKITKEGRKIPILLSHCNPDLFFPYRVSRKDVKYLRQVIKANVKYSLMLGEGHSCLIKYSMVYIDWIFSILSSYKNSKYKKKEFSYSLLDGEKEADNIRDFVAR